MTGCAGGFYPLARTAQITHGGLLMRPRRHHEIRKNAVAEKIAPLDWQGLYGPNSVKQMTAAVT
jgi:hypothetical protein